MQSDLKTGIIRETAGYPDVFHQQRELANRLATELSAKSAEATELALRQTQVAGDVARL